MQAQTVAVAIIRNEQGGAFRSELRERDGEFRWCAIEGDTGEATWDGWTFASVDVAQMTLCIDLLDSAPDLTVEFEEVSDVEG